MQVELVEKKYSKSSQTYYNTPSNILAIVQIHPQHIQFANKE